MEESPQVQLWVSVQEAVFNDRAQREGWTVCRFRSEIREYREGLVRGLRGQI